MNYQTDQSLSIGGNINIGGRLRAGGNAVFTRNVRIEGWLDAPNLKSPCLGLFDSLESLRDACQEPQPGEWALVAAGNGEDGKLRVTVYTAASGEWKAGDTYPLDVDIDLATKADKAMFVTLSDEDYDALPAKNDETYYFIFEE